MFVGLLSASGGKVVIAQTYQEALRLEQQNRERMERERIRAFKEQPRAPVVTHNARRCPDDAKGNAVYAQYCDLPVQQMQGANDVLPVTRGFAKRPPPDPPARFGRGWDVVPCGPNGVARCRVPPKPE